MSIRTTSEQGTSTNLQVTGMDCADCAATIGRNVGMVEGVMSADVSFASSRMVVVHDESLPISEIIATVERTGYGATVAVDGPVAEKEPEGFWIRDRRAVETSVSGLATAAGLVAMALGVEVAAQGLFGVAIVIGGYRFARRGAYSLVHSRVLDINVLMSIAVIGAIVIGQWEEAAVVAFLFALGNFLESLTIDRARSAITTLMKLAPAEARVIRGDQRVSLPTREVNVGDVIVVSEGERIPLDGQVIAGGSSVNQAPITGESMPVDKSIGDEVFAGSVNGEGYLEVMVSRPYQENTINRIIKLVEEAQAKKAPVERFVDSFARRYTPTVVAIAGLIMLVPWLGFGQTFESGFYRALVLLVIACPCALVISTPVATVAGIARAARAGLLIKGGAYLEAAGSIRALAFDKTGTLTHGRPEVVDIVPADGNTADDVIRIAAAIESRSSHPFALAILRYQRHSGQLVTPASDFVSLTGRGARARVEGQVGYIGSHRLFDDLRIDYNELTEAMIPHESAGRTTLLVAKDSRCVGLIAVEDTIRPEARDAVDALHRAGIRPVIVLSGDRERTARFVADYVGADEVRAGLLPGQKADAITELTARYGPVAMVGDGVNDGPALATASVGIAMGVVGSDVALETADIALMSDNLNKIPTAIRLSSATLATIRQNVSISLATKVLFVALGALGLVGLWVAVFADMGISLLVTANAMRLLKLRDS